jgi:hypothetical protein
MRKALYPLMHAVVLTELILINIFLENKPAMCATLFSIDLENNFK